MKKQFFESIKCNEGKIFNIEFHNDRVNKTRRDIFGIDEKIKLQDYIKIPDNNFYKCRIIYSEKIEKVEFHEYKILDRKKFKVIEIPENTDYSHKTTKRDFINEAFSKKGDCDDIIMKRGEFLTDSSVANTAYFIDGEWITPKNPISVGTTRTRLLKELKLIEGEIRVEDISKIEKFAIMNALFGFMEIEDFEIII